MRSFLVLSVCAVLYAGVKSASAPFVIPCHATDDACILASAQKALPVFVAGIPALGVKSLDPMHIDLVTANEAGLKMEFRNTAVKGLRNCGIMNIRTQSNGDKTYMELKCSVTLVGDYTLGGQLLVLPIEGTGKYKIKIQDIIVKIWFEVTDRQVNGETFWPMVSWRHTADVQTGAVFQFQNLFNGNKQLSDSIHEFANTNWKDIFHEVAPPIVKAIVTNIVNEVRKLYDNVPKNQLVIVKE